MKAAFFTILVLLAADAATAGNLFDPDSCEHGWFCAADKCACAEVYYSEDPDEGIIVDHVPEGMPPPKADRLYTDAQANQVTECIERCLNLEPYSTCTQGGNTR